MTGQTIRTADDGTIEKLCRKCGEWWPATDEFFFRNPRNKVNFRSPCKACIAEKRQQTNAVKPCCVPGCTNPRYSWRYSRCYEHRYHEAVAKPRREAALKS